MTETRYVVLERIGVGGFCEIVRAANIVFTASKKSSRSSAYCPSTRTTRTACAR